MEEEIAIMFLFIQAARQTHLISGFGVKCFSLDKVL